MIPISFSTLVKILHAKSTDESVNFCVEGMSTDTRNIFKGDCFVALIGENFDGHLYVEKAASLGAVAAIVSETGLKKIPSGVQIPLVIVADTLLALGQVSAWNRTQFTGDVVAITGTAGKTSVKKMLQHVFEEKGTSCATQGNFNNHIGVPLTLLQIDNSYQSAIIELGASSEGEIAYTVNFTQPQISIITNVSSAHLEGFGDIDTIMRTKGEIIDVLPNSGYAILNADDNYIESWKLRAIHCQVLTFGIQHPANIRGSNVQCHDRGCTFDVLINFPEGVELKTEVSISLLGLHNIMNALATIGAALAAKIPLIRIVQSLKNMTPPERRMEWKQGVRQLRILDDSYNATPVSVKAAIDVIAQWESQAWLVLGDMFELGSSAQSVHYEIGCYAKQKNIKNLLVIGNETKNTLKGYEGGQWFSNKLDLLSYIKKYAQPNDVILIKGSRGMRMDEVVDALI
jgi:UDP-N-acetylmuramoyl-tripeptide--D-alanyl-D-alanine ligase